MGPGKLTVRYWSNWGFTIIKRADHFIPTPLPGPTHIYLSSGIKTWHLGLIYNKYSNGLRRIRNERFHLLVPIYQDFLDYSNRSSN